MTVNPKRISKKIVLLGVDFKMDYKVPYYKNTAEKYNKFHVDHNNKLYANITPNIQKIYKLLKDNYKYKNINIVSGSPIASMPFIEQVDINNVLDDEIISWHHKYITL